MQRKSGVHIFALNIQNSIMLKHFEIVSADAAKKPRLFNEALNYR